MPIKKMTAVILGMAVSSLVGQEDLSNALVKNLLNEQDSRWLTGPGKLLHLKASQRIAWYLLGNHCIKKYILDDLSRHLVTFEGHMGCVYSAVFNGAGDKVLTASWDKTAKLWDVETGTGLRAF